ncbi:MAG: acyl-CoA thioesterase [Saprospiraceae bacterium]|nr:acyl-CoA thioesterase [Bacteroidia bacterium]NNE14352.1 acyl-CoA thioesterase [Saprospiraceae bacterium]NNL92069.1 acyl-CoA thioesterase [Saprospiraceae bacterium]
MYSFSYHQRVRYAETDKMGYLYYGHYAKYYEIGRVEALRNLGLSYKSMEDELGVMLPVLSLESRFRLPAYYDENVEIKTILTTLPNKMIVFNHELYNEANKLINTAEVKLFFVDMKSNKRISCPQSLLEKLKPYFE